MTFVMDVIYGILVADPSPTELIVKFLAIAHDPKETNINEPIMIDGEGENNQNGKPPHAPAPRCSKKSLALKILALKVAAHLNWNMLIFEKRYFIIIEGVFLGGLYIDMLLGYINLSKFLSEVSRTIKYCF